jgi:hypothetical protein
MRAGRPSAVPLVVPFDRSSLFDAVLVAWIVSAS